MFTWPRFFHESIAKDREWIDQGHYSWIFDACVDHEEVRHYLKRGLEKFLNELEVPYKHLEEGSLLIQIVISWNSRYEFLFDVIEYGILNRASNDRFTSSHVFKDRLDSLLIVYLMNRIDASFSDFKIDPN